MSDYSPYRAALDRAVAHAKSYLGSLDTAPVSATASLQELRTRFARPLTDDGVAAERVIDDLAKDVDGGLIGNAGGRFFAWVIGGSLPAALAADWLTSTWDQNAGIYACSPAAGVVEEVAGSYLKELLGLPARASFAFVTGTQMAHVISLAAARHALLARRGWNVEERGLTRAPETRIIVGAERHGTVDRAVRLLGMGSDNIQAVPLDDRNGMDVDGLREALREGGDRPTIVVLQAGELNTGSFDRFSELIPVAHARNAWVHVDGAFGLWAAASPKHRHFMKDASLADSWSTDGHKWLNVPYDSGYAFVADAEAHHASMTHRSSYMMHEGDARDEVDWNPEWSRRARGLATYAAIRSLGRSGIADLIDRSCQQATALVQRIGALPGAEVMWEPLINQGLVRFRDERPTASELDHDARTDSVIDEILAAGEAFFGGVTWRGRRCMRVSVSSWQTTEADVERTVNAVESAVRAATQRSSGGRAPSLAH
ncbi:MAG TPA: aminotransferase class V-fold PLP-dependent enzyme [Gemmatimonadaceae bacterium]|nr:aminotransferase class V-fold PLP-dependent enzyme [Gemmatimonadaceae bacterium]